MIVREVRLELDHDELMDELRAWLSVRDGIRLIDESGSGAKRSALRKALRHDVQSPLAVILGQAELVALGPVDERQRESLEAIQRNCERLSSMLRLLADEHAPN